MWIIPAESVESARFIMRKIYGEDDLQPAEKVDVKSLLRMTTNRMIHTVYVLLGARLHMPEGVMKKDARARVWISWKEISTASEPEKASEPMSIKAQLYSFTVS